MIKVAERLLPCFFFYRAGAFLMDKFGRRVVLMAITAPFTIGWLLITLAINPGWFCSR